MKYPGIEIPLIKIHLNLFTAPMIFSMLIFLLALYLLIYHFDGKWHIYEKMQKVKNNNNKNDIIINNGNILLNRNLINDEIIKNGNGGIQCWITKKLNATKQKKNKGINRLVAKIFNFDLLKIYTQKVILHLIGLQYQFVVIPNLLLVWLCLIY